MKQLPRLSRFMSAIMICLLIAGAGCKSKKKAMEAQAAADKAKMEQEAALQREKEREAELQRQREAEEQARRDAEAKRNQAPAERLDLYFNAIANSNNVTAANSTISETLALFASPDTPVLIVISEENGQKDYDRPTTISNYLNYLKDTKRNINRISDVKVDASGKITELELVKQK